MINIILIILIINQIYNIIFKPKQLTLNCGLFGFEGNINKFNLHKFNLLGVVNQDRGRDAIGVVTNKTIVHETTTDKYLDYIGKNQLIIPKKDISYVAGHVRKSSDYSNKKLKEYTQPVIDWNEELTKFNYIFSHNGTLFKHEELYDLYLNDLNKKQFLYLDVDDGSVKYNDINDSNVLMQALINKKYEILENYAGTAAFAFYDNIKNELYLYSGKSKNSYGYYEGIERPLSYLQGEDYIWYSSEDSALDAICNPDKENVQKVEPNTLMIFKNGKLINTVEIDRTNAGQTVSNTKIFNQVNTKVKYNESYYNNPARKALNSYKPTIDKGEAYKEEYQIFRNESIVKSSNFVQFKNGRYILNGKFINGIYHLTERGFVKEHSDYTTDLPSMITDVYYFIDGVMLTDHTDYNKITRLIKRNNLKRTDTEYFNILCKYSVYPISNIFSTYKEFKKIFYRHCTINNVEGPFRADTDSSPLFCNKTYKFKNGYLIETNIKPVDKQADHSYRRIDSPKYSYEKEYCEKCGKELDFMESDLCDKCKGFYGILEDEFPIKNNTKVSDLPFDADFTITELKAELNLLDFSISDLKDRISGGNNLFFTEVERSVDDIYDKLTQLYNWIQENDIDY